MKIKTKKAWFKKPSQKVSERMKRVRSFGTGLEAAMANLMKEVNIKYEKQPSLQGRPDFRIKGTNLLIFCDSSFWHGRREKELEGKAFRKNKDFWTSKLIENRRRDARTNRLLKKEGWQVLRFWDTDVQKSPGKVIRKLERMIEKNER